MEVKTNLNVFTLSVREGARLGGKDQRVRQGPGGWETDAMATAESWRSCEQEAAASRRTGTDILLIGGKSDSSGGERG